MLNATLMQPEALCSTQLYHMLVMLCKRTALMRVVNAGASWRAVVLHHEPTSLTRSAGLLQELLNFNFEGEIAARMAQHDRDIDRFEKASGENFPNQHPHRSLMPDGPLTQHLVLNSARLTTWETLKAEIDSVRRAQAAASSTPQPTDLSAYGAQEFDAFHKGKSRGKGKDKGKRKDDLPKRPCPICGKAGHWKRGCWYNEANLKPKDKSKGKEGKGKSSANTQQQAHKDKKSVKYWNCNAQGHVAKDCPKKSKSLSAVESRAPPSSGATGETTTLSGFFLNAFEEEAELTHAAFRLAVLRRKSGRRPVVSLWEC